MSDSPEPWPSVRRELERLLAQLPVAGGTARDLNIFAASFGRLTRAYAAAILTTGKTSMRIEAAVLALDLHTPKSAILRFLGRAP